MPVDVTKKAFSICKGLVLVQPQAGAEKFCPVEIPMSTVPDPKSMANNYLQVYFKWKDTSYNWVVRAHEPIPSSSFFSEGQVWVVNRRLRGVGSSLPEERVLLNDGSCFLYKDEINPLNQNTWMGLIYKQKIGTITDTEKLILNKGHFKAK